ncbi:MAG TPA: ATP-grasp domain-containing protein [Rhizomicrobium sp.]|jgi:hypothetical protein|nr:ATP-grasp domain-containing protein [Rhizomicrobium sp.]HWA31639.1 ATP-grasp domain-containing protein [Rhizomicrobium sp.]
MAKVLLSTTMMWPAPARLAGAFASCGASVEALAPRRHPVSESKALTKLHPYRPLQAISGLRAVLETSRPDLIIPCDDRAVRHLVALADEDEAFANLAARSIGRLAGYRTILSRAAFLHEASGLGVEIPPIREVGSEADLKAALHDIGLPAVIKTDGSWGGEGVCIVRSHDEALAAFRHLALAPSRLRSLARAAKRQDAHFLLDAVDPQDYAISVQRFVEGVPATCSFAAWSGRIVASLHMDVLETREPCGPATVLNRVFSPQMDEAARAIAKQFGLSGFHGLDFIRDGSGKLFLIEINPRATQICHLALGEGRDLPAALLAAFEGHAAAPRPVVTDASVIALFPQSVGHAAHHAGAYHDLPADDPDLLHALSAQKDGRESLAALQNG